MNEELNQLQEELDTLESQAEAETPEVPVKYRNKQIDDIIRMHQEAEKKLGELGNENGQLKKLADSIIQQQLALHQQKPPAEEPQEELDDADFFTNPKDAIAKAIRNNPELKQYRDQLASIKQQEALRSFSSKHPDYQSIISDGEFKDWVSASPVRKKLYNDANNFDADAADELFSTWKALSSVHKQSSEKVQEETAQAVKAADVGSTGGQGATGGKKIFRKYKLLELIQRDPDTYYSPEFQQEIQLAYQEGRVK